MNKQNEALKMAIEFIERHVEADEYDWLIQACKEALAEAEKQEPVACPYPCGWDNLYKSIIEQGAYLARKRHENNENDEVFDEFLCSMNNIAKYLCEWGKSLTHPATWQSLSDDEIASVIKTTFPVNVAVTNVDLKFARAIEQALKDKNKF